MEQESKKENRGAKSKYTPEIVKEICDYIKAGNTAIDACLLSNISKATFYGWQQQFEADGVTPNPEFHLEFLDAIKKAELECKARNIAIIQRAAAGRKLKRTKKLKDGTVVEEEYDADKPNWFAAAWYLERKHKKDFAQKVEQEHSTGEQGFKVILETIKADDKHPLEENTKTD